MLLIEDSELLDLLYFTIFREILPRALLLAFFIITLQLYFSTFKKLPIGSILFILFIIEKTLNSSILVKGLSFSLQFTFHIGVLSNRLTIRIIPGSFSLFLFHWHSWLLPEYYCFRSTSCMFHVPFHSGKFLPL